MGYQAPKGTRDFFPPELALLRCIESAWRNASINAGFEEICKSDSLFGEVTNIGMKAEISIETAMTDAWNWELKKMK